MKKRLLLSKKQVEAIEWLKLEGYNFDDIINGHIYGWSSTIAACLNSLAVADIAKILYAEDYEVEKPNFKNGGKFIYLNGYELGTLIDGVVYWRDKSETEDKYLETMIEDGDVRVATDEDLFWLEDLKRNSVPDFRKHDVYVDKNMDAWLLGKDITVDAAHEIYQNGDFLGVYSIDSFKSFHKQAIK